MPQTEKNSGLARRLGLVAATLTGLGVIIGSGIYVIIGVAAGQSGNAVWLAFLIAAVAAGLTAMSYARLGKLRPKNAPEYHFVNMAFGSQPAFLAGWLILIAQIVSSSAVALGFAGYLHAITGLPELPAAMGLIIVCCLILFIGISESAAAAVVLTIVEILGLVIIIIIGAPHFGDVNYMEMPLGLAGVFAASSLVFFAFLGFEGMANLSEEIKDPEKNLPRAIIMALALSTFFYLLVAFAAVSVVGWEALSESSSPLALVAAEVLGSRAGFILTLISLASTANTVLVLLLAGSRVLHGMSCAAVLPGFFCRMNERRKTPWVAIIVAGLVAMLFASFQSIQQIAEFTNFITLLAFIGVNASALRLLRPKGSHHPARHLLFNRIVPGLGIAVSIWLAVNAGSDAAIFGAVVLAAGLLVYWGLVLFQKRKA